MWKRYLINMMTKIMNKLIEQYKNPYNNQYVAPYGYCFYMNGVNQGRIIWTSRPENYYIDKDDNG